MMNQVVSASQNEFGSYKTGEFGDQTGREVRIQNWYSGGWSCVLRYKDSSVAAKAAAIAVKLANSPLVGYSQNTRTTLKFALAACDWDVDKYLESGRRSNCDCSSFVYVCFACVVPSIRDMYPPTTGSMPNSLLNHGFTVIRDRSYLISHTNLLPGDLVDKESAHVVIYVGDSNNLPSTPEITDTATEVTQVEFDCKNELLREVGYLTDTLSPSISKSTILLSLYNTSVFQTIMGASSVSTYNIDKLPQNCKIVVQYLIDKGLNLAGALGVAANMKQESGWRADAINSTSGAAGLCQWYSGRKLQMIQFVGSDWKINMTRQLDFLWQELSGSYYKNVMDILKSVPNSLEGAKQATEYFLRHFEIPGNYSIEVPRRTAIVTQLWEMCAIIIEPDVGSSNGINISVGSKKTVTIPTSISQSGLIPNYTNYSYWFSKWRYTQRKIADEWSRTGKQHVEYVASIAGYRLVAVSPIFGIAGDLIKVTLDDETTFGAIIADSKGGDASNVYGHVLNGKVDIIEWEMAGISSSSVDSLTQSRMKLTGLRGKHVKSISNYGQYKKW